MNLKDLKTQINNIESELENPDRTKSVEYYTDLNKKLNFLNLLSEYDPNYLMHHGNYYYDQKSIHTRLKFMLTTDELRKIYYDYLEEVR